MGTCPSHFIQAAIGIKYPAYLISHFAVFLFLASSNAYCMYIYWNDRMAAHFNAKGQTNELMDLVLLIS